MVAGVCCCFALNNIFIILGQPVFVKLNIVGHIKLGYRLNAFFELNERKALFGADLFNFINRFNKSVLFNKLG